MSTSLGGSVRGEIAGVTVSVTTLLAFGAFGLSYFAGSGLVGSASFVLLPGGYQWPFFLSLRRCSEFDGREHPTLSEKKRSRRQWLWDV
jgi:hypothetical protein